MSPTSPPGSRFETAYRRIFNMVAATALGLHSAREARSSDLGRRGLCGAPISRRPGTYCHAVATGLHPLGYPWRVCGIHARNVGSTDGRALITLYGPEIKNILLEVAGGRMSVEDGVLAAWARWVTDHPEDRPPRLDFALTAEFTDVLPWKEA